MTWITINVAAGVHALINTVVYLFYYKQFSKQKKILDWFLKVTYIFL